MKYIIYSVMALFLFTGCMSGPTFNYTQKQNELSFQIDEKTKLVQRLQNPKYAYTFDGCTNDSYTINEARYFVEYISLDSSCRWNGLASGYFEYQFKDKLKLKSLSSLERFDIKNYTFATLKVNDKSVINVITVYSAYTDAFIIDYEGSLYTKLLTALKPEYKNQYNDLPRFKSDYKESLVKWNFINSYFNRDREVIER